MATPITAAGSSSLARAAGTADMPGASVPTVGDVAEIHTLATASEISHETVQRVLDITTNVEGRDLGSVAAGVRRAIDSLGTLPVGMTVTLRGQSEVMNTAFRRLALGLIIAVLLVYCLMVVMFQSWLDPFIIMIAVPGALVGILWMLALTGTTINVVSLMGSIMAVGIAVSNSILVVSFANDLRVERGMSAVEAAIESGRVRLRPVLMTALAMILGMMPMAIGASEGGEQNAPLGRAVIGGLLVATIATLFVVPAVYAVLRTAIPTRHLLEHRFALESAGHLPGGPAHGRVPE